MPSIAGAWVVKCWAYPKSFIEKYPTTQNIEENGRDDWI